MALVANDVNGRRKLIYMLLPPLKVEMQLEILCLVRTTRKGRISHGSGFPGRQLHFDALSPFLCRSPFFQSFSRWTLVNRYQNMSLFCILLAVRVMEVVSGDNWSCKMCKPFSSFIPSENVNQK